MELFVYDECGNVNVYLDDVDRDTAYAMYLATQDTIGDLEFDREERIFTFTIAGNCEVC